MEKLINNFKNFVMSYDNEEKEDKVDLLIAWFDTIIGMMDIIMVEDYTIIKKLVSFVKLITAEDYIDDDTRIEIYHRQIDPLLEDLKNRYEDTSSEIVAEDINGFTETHYSEDVENIFRIHKTINDMNTDIIKSLETIGKNDDKLLLRELSKVQEILHTHYMNIVNNEEDVIDISLQSLQNSLNKLDRKMIPSSILRQTTLNLNIICSLLLSIIEDKSRLQYFTIIIDNAFQHIDNVKNGFT